ncbi:MAG TPA: peptidylprolyl isomerase [Burkholderiaceae bacterium]
MKLNLFAAAASAAILLSACGGGSDGPRTVEVTPPPVTSAATITSVTPETTIRYGQPVRFTVAGTNLTSGVTLASAGCATPATVAGATATQIVMTCVPTRSGAVAVNFSPTNSTVVTTVTPSVPVPQVKMVTTKGDIVLELYPNNTPITVANFMQYVNSGYYNGKQFHRVISSFVIQGGGYDANFSKGTQNAPIALEVGKGLSNTRGTIAMARSSDLNSATSEFFINTVDNDGSGLNNLNTSGGGYAVFGKVISGMETVDAIRVVPTGTIAPLGQDVPTTPIFITTATQVQ